MSVPRKHYKVLTGTISKPDALVQSSILAFFLLQRPLFARLVNKEGFEGRLAFGHEQDLDSHMRTRLDLRRKGCGETKPSAPLDSRALRDTFHNLLLANQIHLPLGGRKSGRIS